MTNDQQQEQPATAEPYLPPHLRKPRLRRSELSEYFEIKHGVKIAPATFAKKAVTGDGPPFEKYNNTPLYPTVDADEWFAAKLTAKKQSTSER